MKIKDIKESVMVIQTLIILERVCTQLINTHHLNFNKNTTISTK